MSEAHAFRKRAQASERRDGLLLRKRFLSGPSLLKTRTAGFDMKAITVVCGPYLWIEKRE